MMVSGEMVFEAENTERKGSQEGACRSVFGTERKPAWPARMSEWRVGSSGRSQGSKWEAGQGADCVKPFGTLRAFSHLSLVSQKGRRTE